MLNSLSKILEKKGSKYTESLLNDYIIITEKIDTYRLIFEKKNEEIIFYKKDNTPITIIDRTLSDIYESAFLEIPIITKDANIPENIFFGLSYVPSERPLRIPYSKLPRYILTDVTKRENGKIVETYDYDVVKDWAAVLCMGRPPVLFEGKLNDEQKKLLIAYDTKQYDGETMPFAKMIEKVFNTSYSREDIIEGIVIKSKDKLTQIISYEFELLNEAYEKENEKRDFYDLVITDLNAFLANYNIPLLEAETKDQLYINIVCDIFNNYCKKRNVLESLDAKYLTPPQFGHHGMLNTKFIKNEQTLKWLATSPIYEALFKVFLSSFRKHKKPYGLLTESVVEKFNSYVTLINGYVNKFDENILLEVRSENIVVDAFKKRNPTDVDNMRVIASIQKAFEPKMRDIIKGAKPCAIYVTTFSPFTTAQMENINRINSMWNCPVVLFAISNSYLIEGKEFHPTDALVKAQMQALINENSQLIAAYGLLNSWSLTEMFEYCRPDYEPIVIITDKGKKSEITLQLFLEEEIMGSRLNVDPKFNVGELDNELHLKCIRAIEDNHATVLLELTPHAIHNLLNNIFSEYRIWNGQMLKLVSD